MYARIALRYSGTINASIVASHLRIIHGYMFHIPYICNILYTIPAGRSYILLVLRRKRGIF